MSDTATIESSKIIIAPASAADAAGLTICMLSAVDELDMRAFGYSVDPIAYHAWLQNQIVNNPAFFCAAALDGTNVIGGIAADIGPGPYNIQQIVAYERSWYVKPEYRGSSVAMRLFATLERWAKGFGASLIVSGQAMNSPEKIQNFYSRKQFNPSHITWAKEI